MLFNVESETGATMLVRPTTGATGTGTGEPPNMSVKLTPLHAFFFFFLLWAELPGPPATAAMCEMVCFAHGCSSSSALQTMQQPSAAFNTGPASALRGLAPVVMRNLCCRA